VSKEGRRGSGTTPIRCAIYTRKSTTDGLDSDFSSLDAQREQCEHYVQSQASLGWEILPDRYDDGGFSGSNLGRPALNRLLDEIERGMVGMVVVYKHDRLSRSILDFARLSERFERRGVGIVSITQQLDTSNSTGRLTLNMLMSFAQFERELISERTRDKIQAARRRGKWTGGRVVLGYMVGPGRRGLVVVPEEAQLVRLIFDLYLKTRSTVEVAKTLNAQGHTPLRHVRGGSKVSSGRWTKNSVHRLLNDVTYVGKVRAGDGSLYLGEHEPIVLLEPFEQVARSLKDRTTPRIHRSRKAEYLLTGILRCGPCDSAMTSSATSGRNGQRYRYYRCCREQAEGTPCPTGLLNTGEVEQAVVGQLKELVRGGELKHAVLERLKAQGGLVSEAQATQKRIEGRIETLGVEAKRLLAAFREAGSGAKLVTSRLGEIEAEIDQLLREKMSLEVEAAATDDLRVKDEAVLALLEGFDEVWGALVPEERRGLLHLLVRHVIVDLRRGGLRIALHQLTTGVPTDGAPARAIA
jgi:site-specific DNA recombinase